MCTARSALEFCDLPPARKAPGVGVQYRAGLAGQCGPGVRVQYRGGVKFREICQTGRGVRLEYRVWFIGAKVEICRTGLGVRLEYRAWLIDAWMDGVNQA